MLNTVNKYGPILVRINTRQPQPITSFDTQAIITLAYFSPVVISLSNPDFYNSINQNQPNSDAAETVKPIQTYTDAF